MPLEPEADLEDDVITEESVDKEKERPKSYQMREFFVKWQGKSFWKNSWVSEIRVSISPLQGGIS